MKSLRRFMSGRKFAEENNVAEEVTSTPPLTSLSADSAQPRKEKNSLWRKLSPLSVGSIWRSFSRKDSFRNEEEEQQPFEGGFTVVSNEINEVASSAAEEKVTEEKEAESPPRANNHNTQQSRPSTTVQPPLPMSMMGMVRYDDDNTEDEDRADEEMKVNGELLEQQRPAVEETTFRPQFHDVHRQISPRAVMSLLSEEDDELPLPHQSQSLSQSLPQHRNASPSSSQFRSFTAAKRVDHAAVPLPERLQETLTEHLEVTATVINHDNGPRPLDRSLSPEVVRPRSLLAPEQVTGKPKVVLGLGVVDSLEQAADLLAAVDSQEDIAIEAGQQHDNGINIIGSSHADDQSSSEVVKVIVRKKIKRGRSAQTMRHFLKRETAESEDRLPGIVIDDNEENELAAAAAEKDGQGGGGERPASLRDPLAAQGWAEYQIMERILRSENNPLNGNSDGSSRGRGRGSDQVGAHSISGPSQATTVIARQQPIRTIQQQQSQSQVRAMATPPEQRPSPIVTTTAPASYQQQQLQQQSQPQPQPQQPPQFMAVRQVSPSQLQPQGRRSRRDMSPPPVFRASSPPLPVHVGGVRSRSQSPPAPAINSYGNGNGNGNGNNGGNPLGRSGRGLRGKNASLSQSIHSMSMLSASVYSQQQQAGSYQDNNYIHGYNEDFEQQVQVQVQVQAPGISHFYPRAASPPPAMMNMSLGGNGNMLYNQPPPQPQPQSRSTMYSQHNNSNNNMNGINYSNNSFMMQQQRQNSGNNANSMLSRANSQRSPQPLVQPMLQSQPHPSMYSNNGIDSFGGSSFYSSPPLPVPVVAQQPQMIAQPQQQTQPIMSPQAMPMSALSPQLSMGYSPPAIVIDPLTGSSFYTQVAPEPANVFGAIRSASPVYVHSPSSSVPAETSDLQMRLAVQRSLEDLNRRPVMSPERQRLAESIEESNELALQRALVQSFHEHQREQQHRQTLRSLQAQQRAVVEQDEVARRIIRSQSSELLNSNSSSNDYNNTSRRSPNSNAISSRINSSNGRNGLMARAYSSGSGINGLKVLSRNSSGITTSFSHSSSSGNRPVDTAGIDINNACSSSESRRGINRVHSDGPDPFPRINNNSDHNRNISRSSNPLQAKARQRPGMSSQGSQGSGLSFSDGGGGGVGGGGGPQPRQQLINNSNSGDDYGSVVALSYGELCRRQFQEMRQRQQQAQSQSQSQSDQSSGQSPYFGNGRR